MTFKKTLATILAAGVLTLSGCESRIETGRIYDKAYYPAQTTTVLIPMLCGKITILMPIVQNHPERYALKIENTADGRKRTREVSVSKEAFDSRNIGEVYP